MKKRLLILVGFLLYFANTQSQEQSEHLLFVGAGAVDYKSVTKDRNIQMQIGGALPYNLNINSAKDRNTEVGFPFNILYIPPTFVVDKFQVSKGYFTESVKIEWKIGANQDDITSIRIFRRKLGDTGAFEDIASVSATTFEYNDTQVDGGVLFEYQVIAEGVPKSGNGLGKRTINYMEGIGFRNPTATVSGGITYEGGSPVQDVTVFAEPIGAENRTATSLYVPTSPSGGAAKIEGITNIKADSITFQTWLVNDTNIFSFKLSNNPADTYEIYAGNWNTQTIDFELQKNNQRLSGIKIANSYPTGEIDAAGNDKFASISSLDQKGFVHFSLVIRDGKKAQFFINGREINDTYEAAIKAKNPDLNIRIDDFTGDSVSLANNASNVNITELVLSNGFSNIYMDEVRVWNRALSAEEIRRDYRRYLGGGEAGLAVYLRMDEGAGGYLYDLSKDGFKQNKNDALLSEVFNSTVEFSDTRPTQKQLGVFGVTDVNGSYIISGVGYKGTGESFVVSPSLGVHKFEPASQTVFLGAEAPVVNQLNFTDVSSFKFNGRVVFNVQDVFTPIAVTEPTNLKDYGYNKYLLGSTIINKGEYYYEGGNINSANGFYEGGELKQYTVLGVEGANVLVDGNIVFDADNQPVLTDIDGNFTVNVPIGNHKVEVTKNGHTFELNGRFPETNTFEFFEDAIETQYFTDNTRVTLVGKVVGGKKEFDKPVGFGFDGKKEYTNFEDLEAEVKETISSNNNIGVAQITFKGDVNSSSLDKIITTNIETGEFKVALIPYQYQISQNGISISTNTDISVLTSTETLDLREIPDLKTSEFTTKDNTVLTSETYHYVKSFRYNSDVAVYLLEQVFDTEFTIDDKTFDISGLTTPIYTQREKYKITFEVVQEYINNDGDQPLKTKEFFTEGAFNITNNLAQSDTQTITLKENNTIYEYSFNAGLPNITLADSFAQNISIQYVIEGSNPLSISNASDFKNTGIVKGGRPSAGKTFVTSAPEVPEVILRDPPGTNSFATIEKGTSIKMKTSSASADTGFTNFGLFTSIGPDVTFSQGVIFASVDTQIDVVADFDLNFSRSTENTSSNETEITYTFNQSISTSDDPSFVGADGDLFIGNAKNIYYGIFDNIFITENIPLDLNNATIPNLPIVVKDEDGNDKSLYISTSKDYFIAEQPTNTFFTYSQKYIVETLIPELERLAATGSTPSQGVEAKSATYYTAQADLWKKVVQNNEKSKYDAKNNREAVKNGVIASVVNNLDPSLRSGLTALVNENFYSNRSFDAGLGEFSNSISTSVLTSKSYTSTIDVDVEFALDLGFFINGVGRSMNYTTRTGSIDTDSNTTSQDISNTISYTLKDNDKSNSLSIDVVSMFDGNGPVFITRGGTTSCPYEGETTSIFFKNDGFDASVVGIGGEVLSEATNKVYNAEISVEKNLITNVPESEAAVFKVFIKNTSETQTDLEFILDFDSTSLNGAEINLETNGTSVFLPFNETIEFPIEISKTSSSSRYEYENIKLLLYSPCAFASEKDEISIEINVEFKKSCSNVAISSPENNWVFNTNEAYSLDINGKKTINTLPITFTDFNADFNGFEKIELQYRNASASNWTKLQSYYGSSNLRDTAGDSEGIVINSSDTDFTYNWDVVGDNITDGNYEFRAISFCADNISNTSEIISGIVNLNTPLVFGTPKPTDGILDVGEDISVRFNEAIFERTTTSISVTGLKNQQEIDHSVSVFLDGSANQIELLNQRLNGESFTLQFWLDSDTTGSGTLVSQENGINIKIDGNNLEFAVGGEIISTATVNKPIDDSQFNFYSFVYQNGGSPQLLIMENGEILEEATLEKEIDINTSSSIFIGGQNVIGNLHDVRLWSKPFTAAQAAIAKDLTLTGRELNLQGYWKLDEGFGTTGLDKAKRKNAIVNLDWAIKPVGTGYEFKNSEYLTLDNVGFIQPSNFEDKTISFWIKPTATSAGTIFSNGRGNDDEIVLTNGFRNKWSINLKTDSHLELVTEDISYKLTANELPANKWTHVAIVHKVGGTLNSYIDGKEESSVSAVKVGGFTGNKILIGARLFEDFQNNETIENHFTGLLDEVRFWNTARSLDQIKRDRYFEIDNSTEGLLLKIDFNEDAGNTSNGPTYNHLAANLTKGNTFSILSGATQSYTQDSPPLKPQLQFTNIPYTTIINGDEMIITPNLTDTEWSLFEGEIINFSVARLSDTHFNTQQSPVTWSALVNRQELEWFTENQTKEIIAEKILGETYSFTMDVVNIGGSNQPFTITGLPTWMQAELTTGSISPDSSREILFTVDKDLAMGNYTADIFLETTSGFNDRLSFNMRVLSEAPNWSVNATSYSYSMNFIGKIQIDGVFSRDEYTKVGAFVNDEPRGEAYLKYDTAFDSYFLFLTAYSNEVDVNNAEEVTFKIWDAINGKIIKSSMDNLSEIDFMINGIEGSKSIPKVFANTNLAEQNLALNKGWTWVSLYANDNRLQDVTETFKDLELTETDGIKSQTLFANFEDGFWDGNLTQLFTTEMYKIRLGKANQLRLLGQEIAAADFTININGKSTSDDGTEPQWNWLPFPIHRDIALEEALAFYQPTEGDVIKDQFNFAIYDASSGWSGTLNYLQSGKGYMLNASETQSFNYPDANVLQKTSDVNKVAQKTNTDNNNFAQYSSNMNIVTEVIGEDSFTKVLVFDADNMLRGTGDIIDLNNKKISFITAFSNTNETLKFVLANDSQELDINKNFVFINNLVLGNLKNPVQLSANALSLDNLVLSDAVLYPNPFKSELVIDLSSDNIDISKVEIFNTIGISIISKRTNTKQKITINTVGLANGIYLVRLTDKSGKFAVKKMIKE